MVLNHEQSHEGAAEHSINFTCNATMCYTYLLETSIDTWIVESFSCESKERNIYSAICRQTWYTN